MKKAWIRFWHGLSKFEHCQPGWKVRLTLGTFQIVRRWSLTSWDWYHILFILIRQWINEGSHRKTESTVCGSSCVSIGYIIGYRAHGLLEEFMLRGFGHIKCGGWAERSNPLQGDGAKRNTPDSSTLPFLTDSLHAFHKCTPKTPPTCTMHLYSFTFVTPLSHVDVTVDNDKSLVSADCHFDVICFAASEIGK